MSTTVPTAIRPNCDRRCTNTDEHTTETLTTWGAWHHVIPVTEADWGRVTVEWVQNADPGDDDAPPTAFVDLDHDELTPADAAELATAMNQASVIATGCRTDETATCPPWCELHAGDEHSTKITAITATANTETIQLAVDEDWDQARMPIVSVRATYDPTEDDAPFVSLLVSDTRGMAEVGLRLHEARKLVALVTDLSARVGLPPA